MPRNVSGVYSYPPGTTVTTNTTIASAPFNAFLADLLTDLNAERPIVAGGTGAATIQGALDNFFDGTTFVEADNMRIADAADNTKLVIFDASAITTATTRTITLPDANVDLELLDEDDMASDSATKAASQQSIKAYVDGEVVGYQFVLRHTATSTSNGGAATATTWTKRTMTSHRNTITGASVASSVITLPAGTYRVRGWQSFFNTGDSQCRLRNTTDGSTTANGASVNANSSTNPLSDTIFTIASSKDFEFQYYIATSAGAQDLGNAVGSGEIELYAELIIEDIS